MADYKAAIQAGIKASNDRSAAISDVIRLIDEASTDCLELTGCVEIESHYAGFSGDIHVSNSKERKKIARIDVSDSGYPMRCSINGRHHSEVDCADSLREFICAMLADGWVGMSIIDMKTNKERDDRIAAEELRKGSQ